MISVIAILANIGVDVTPLLAGAGVVGLAFSFGAQQLVQDVITGFFIIFEDTIAIGDTVTAESEIVEVSEKGWVRLAGRVIGPDGSDVLRATIRGYPGRFEDR